MGKQQEDGYENPPKCETGQSEVKQGGSKEVKDN